MVPASKPCSTLTGSAASTMAALANDISEKGTIIRQTTLTMQCFTDINVPRTFHVSIKNGYLIERGNLLRAFAGLRFIAAFRLSGHHLLLRCGFSRFEIENARLLIGVSNAMDDGNG